MSVLSSQRVLLALALALASLLVGLAFFWQPENPAALPAPATARPAPGGDFTLESAAGPVSLRDYRGKAVLLSFGYTSCPDICPTALATIASGLQQLRPEEAGRAAAIFVSVDPQRDSPKRLKEYVAFFHPALVGVTGTPEAVAATAGLYGAFYARQGADTAGGYVVDHTADIYVIDPAGRLAGRIPHGTAPSQVAAEIRRHL